MKPFTMRIFIGYDPREAVAYHVLAHSILRQISCPVEIIPLSLHALRNEKSVYRRPRGPEATEFSYSRFLVPYLCGYEGEAIFMDCDMLVQVDLDSREQSHQTERPFCWQCDCENYAVRVVKHDYTPKTAIKMDGQVQTAYPRKNWSSFMIFNNELCRTLTPEYVNEAPGADLHRLAWLKDEQVGALDLDYNWLVGEYEPKADARVLHYTLGGPWFPGYETCDHADLWLAEKARALGGAPTH